MLINKHVKIRANFSVCNTSANLHSVATLNTVYMVSRHYGGYMAKVKETRIIESTTGEIVKCETKSITYFTEKGYMVFARNNYSRVFTDIRIPSCFTDSELGKIYRLQACIQQNTNMLVKRTNGIRRPMTYIEIAKETGLSDRLGKEFLKKLLDSAIIGTIEKTTGGITRLAYYFNPLYFHNSKWLTFELYDLFKKQLDPYLPVWVKIEYEQINRDKVEKEDSETVDDKEVTR